MFSLLLSTFLSKLQTLSASQWVALAVCVILLLALLEQLIFQRKRGSLPGPTWFPPLLGNIVYMVQNPFKFWHDMFQHPLAVNSIVGKFVVVVTKSENVRKIFLETSEEMPLALHPNAHTLLGTDNIAFLNGSEHKHLRMKLLPLFTTHALKMYVDIQVHTIRDYMQKWSAASASSPSPLNMRKLIYDLNTYTSMSVFMGPYLNEATRAQLVVDYTALTEGMFALPIYFPGTKLYQGRQARFRILAVLEQVVKKSKAAMENGTPSCLLDFWMQNCVKEIAEAQSKGEEMPPHSSDEQVAKIVLDFLFASQDASTSSLTFSTHFLCERPDVLAKVRAEIAAVHAAQADPKAPFEITADTLPGLRYTWQVMKEVLRIRPPATIVPHINTKEYPIEDEYTCPVGSLIVPSIWNSNRQGFSNPEAFDPDRFSLERAEDKKYEKNFLTFGVGPHMCMGQRYAMNHIMCFIALLAHEYEFERHISPNMNEIKYLPTIYPADDCMVKSFKHIKA